MVVALNPFLKRVKQMYKIIETTQHIAYDYLQEFGFSDEQILPLIDQAKIDLKNELDRLNTHFNNKETDLNQINSSLHTLKGIFANLGNLNISDKLGEIRSNVDTNSYLQDIKELLFNDLKEKPLDIDTLNQNNLKILYVEDDEMVRFSTKEILEVFFQTGVDVAVNGEDGLKKYETFYQQTALYYDIVITDINMPKMNGIEMIKAILKLNELQDIIVISAHNDASYLLELINIGISNFLLKPIKIDIFKHILTRTMQKVQNEKTIKKFNNDIQKMNIDLQQAKLEAEAASNSKSKFLANMSHEIRTPLNAITGFISILNDIEDDPKKLEYLKIIRNSSDSLLEIINDILDISKIESGKLDINPINFNPYDDLISVAELFQAKAAEKGVVLKIIYNNNMPNFLFSDSLRIKQILSNLLSNAIKFTPEGLNVKCIVWYAKGKLNIKVKDYGIGIPHDKQESIFHSFTQAQNSTEREYGGTGLGLTISAKLTEMLNGTLVLKSQEDKGSVFSLSIPMKLGEKPAKESSKETTTKLPIGLHILLVEDNKSNQIYMGIILDNVKASYEIANNGLEAVKKFKTGSYDIILMDENMPILSGIGATKAILELEKEQTLKHTPIISLTANALIGDRERFLQAGMDDYISKPVEPNRLIQTIYKLL